MGVNLSPVVLNLVLGMEAWQWNLILMGLGPFFEISVKGILTLTGKQIKDG